MHSDSIHEYSRYDGDSPVQIKMSTKNLFANKTRTFFFSNLLETCLRWTNSSHNWKDRCYKVFILSFLVTIFKLNLIFVVQHKRRCFLFSFVFNSRFYFFISVWHSFHIFQTNSNKKTSSHTLGNVPRSIVVKFHSILLSMSNSCLL